MEISGKARIWTEYFEHHIVTFLYYYILIALLIHEYFVL